MVHHGCAPPGSSHPRTSLWVPVPPTLEQVSVLPWPPTGDFQNELTLCSQFPIQLNQAGGGVLGKPAPSRCWLTWLGGQGREAARRGSSPDTGQEEVPCLSCL